MTKDEAAQLSPTQRYRLRKKGIDVPLFKPGGSRMSRPGPKNGRWKGDGASIACGRERARNWYPNLSPCQNILPNGNVCGNPKTERHHIDGNPLNNDPSNIIIVCRSCHMKIDKRFGTERALRLNIIRWHKHK